MVSEDRRLPSEYNRAVNYDVRDVVPRCERGRYIERRLLFWFLDAGNNETVRRLSSPASEKRQRTKSLRDRLAEGTPHLRER